MREAHTLQRAGHKVTVAGIAESGETRAEERLSDGVRVIRVSRRDRRSPVRTALRVVIAAIVVLAIVYGTYRIMRLFVSGASALLRQPSATDLHRAARFANFRSVYALAAILAVATALFGLFQGGKGIRQKVLHRARNKEVLRRQVISGLTVLPPNTRFPAIRSRIPYWIPDWTLELVTLPFGLLGAPVPSFSNYRRLSRQLASVALGLGPDVVHCHDCSALPAGWIVKKTLGIPLVYDAHEIYEAVAARRLGATDYFARIHAKYLPVIDGFIAVNDSAATYYAKAYPQATPAVVIRNATEQVHNLPYDGRLHRAANLPLEHKILLYQGGFTKHRGLETLVQSAALLPEHWSLVMMGSGTLLETLQDLARHSDTAKRGHFIPAAPVTELNSWTQGATVGIVPYEDVVLNHWIATPNKLWEYPSAGVPMIVQPFPEMRRIVESYGCGWVLPHVFSPEAIASLLAQLTDEMIERARAGCRRFIEADNWDALYRERLLRLYERLGPRVLANGGTETNPHT